MPTGTITVNVKLKLRRPRLCRMLVRTSQLVIEAAPSLMAGPLVDVFGWLLFRTCYVMSVGGRKI